MKKYLRIFVIQLIALILLSCSNLTSPKQGKISVQLPGTSKAARKVVEGTYSKEEAGLYKVTLTGIDSEFYEEKEGEPGATIVFSSLEPGKYKVDASAYKITDSGKLCIAKIAAPIEVTVNAGETAVAPLKLIPLTYEYDDGEPDKDPKITELVISLSGDAEYLNYSDLVSYANEETNSQVKELFDISFVFDNGKISEPISLEEVSNITASMPYSTNRAGNGIPYVGPVPFSFSFTDSDVGIEDVEVSILYISKQPSESNIQFMNRTKSTPVENSKVKIPAVTGQIDISANLNLSAETYYLYDNTVIQDSYTTELIPVSGTEVNSSVEKNGSTEYLKITADGTLGNKSGTYSVSQKTTLVQSDYAVPVNADLCSVTKSMTVEVVPYKISDKILNSEGLAITGKLFKNTYTFEAVNEADADLEYRTFKWTLSPETKGISLSRGNSIPTIKIIVSELLESETSIQLACSLLDSNEEEIVAFAPVSLTIAAADATEILYFANLVQTDSNKEYVIKGDDDKLFVLSGKPLQISDFEFKKSVNGVVETVTDTNNLVFGGELYSAILGNVPVTIKNNIAGSDEVYSVEVPFRTYSLAPEITIVSSQKDPENFALTIRANNAGYNVYNGNTQINAKDIHYEVTVLKAKREICTIYDLTAVSDETIVLNLVDLDKSNSLKKILDFGTYDVTVKAWATNDDYSEYFLQNEGSYKTADSSFEISTSEVKTLSTSFSGTLEAGDTFSLEDLAITAAFTGLPEALEINEDFPVYEKFEIEMEEAPYILGENVKVATLYFDKNSQHEKSAEIKAKVIHTVKVPTTAGIISETDDTNIPVFTLKAWTEGLSSVLYEFGDHTDLSDRLNFKWFMYEGEGNPVEIGITDELSLDLTDDEYSGKTVHVYYTATVEPAYHEDFPSDYSTYIVSPSELSKKSTVWNYEVPVKIPDSYSLKQTDSNKDYVLSDKDGNLFVNVAKLPKNTGLSLSDFEIIQNGKFFSESDLSGYTVNVPEGNWNIIGNDIPVTLTRDGSEEYTILVTMKTTSQATFSNIEVSLNSDYSYITPKFTISEKNYTVYEFGITKTLPHDEIKYLIELYKENEKVADNPNLLVTASVNSDPVSFYLVKDGGVAPGTYKVNIKAYAYNKTYEYLFVQEYVSQISDDPSKITDTITVPESVIIKENVSDWTEGIVTPYTEAIKPYITAGTTSPEFIITVTNIDPITSYSVNMTADSTLEVKYPLTIKPGVSNSAFAITQAVSLGSDPVFKISSSLKLQGSSNSKTVVYSSKAKFIQIIDDGTFIDEYVMFTQN